MRNQFQQITLEEIYIESISNINVLFGIADSIRTINYSEMLKIIKSKLVSSICARFGIMKIYLRVPHILVLTSNIILSLDVRI